jgi:hypothetical protein
MDEAAPTAARGNTGRKLAILVIVIVLVTVGWTSGWFWLTGEVGRRLDDQLAALEARGLHASCPNRTIGGWPFRVDIDCSNVTLKQINQLTMVSLRHVRVTALIYNPTLVIAELDGPLAATGPNGETINATWSRLRSSIGFSLSPSIRPQRLAVEAEDLAAGVARPGAQEVKLTAAHAEVHGRQDPDAKPASNDLDLALDLTAATLSVGGHIVGPEATDYAVNAVARALPMAPIAGEPFVKTWANEGGRLDLRAVRLSLGGFAIDGQGYLTAGSDGLANGKIRLVASGINTLMSPAAATLKGRAELLGLATAFMFGSLDLTIDQGKAKIGQANLGQIPPLF